jgi:hypothetical protein
MSQRATALPRWQSQAASFDLGCELAALAVSERDRHVLTLARRKLGSSQDFGEALRALAEATRELIPAGRIYLLGRNAEGPIVGSVISGVGLFVRAQAIVIGRVDRQGGVHELGSFSH